MRPSSEPTCSFRALWKLGLLVLVILLPLMVMSCASTKQLAQELEENHGTFLTPLPAEPVSQPAAQAAAQPAAIPAGQPAALPVAQPAPLPVAQPADKLAAKQKNQGAPLKVCSVVSEDDLQDMRGCLGVYYFSYNFDINLLTTPQVTVSTNFQAVLPDGSPAPTVNTTSAVFKDSNVSYVAGPTSNGLSSQLLVSGHDNIVFANTTYTIHLPNASVLTPNINVMPANSLQGIGK
jgi:hypothetical protein